MDQQLENKSTSDISEFVESIHSTQDLHFLACHALQKWADSLADGIPSGYEKLKLWLDIRGDLNGKVSAAPGVPELPVPVMTKVKEEAVVSKPPPVFLKVTSTTADALSAPSSSDVPPPHSRKRKAPPSELFVSPSISKPNMRLSSVESNENLADGPAMDATASASPVVNSNPVSSGLDIWNVPSKKARVESIDAIFSSRPAACSESECGHTFASTLSCAMNASNTSSASSGANASGSDAQGSGASTSNVANKRLCWTAEMDDRLREAVQLYREDGWQYVAEHFGSEATARQCQKRYIQVLQHLEQGVVRNEKWTEAEMAALEQLVLKHTVPSHYSRRTKAMTQQRIDWTSLGREIGRVPRQCADKWERMQAAGHRNAGTGETNKAASSGYAATACSSTPSSSSSSSASSSSDDESSAGSDSETDSGSDSDSSSSSSSSASSTLSKGPSIRASDSGALSAAGTRNSSSVSWTKEEEERLVELVKQHTIPSHWDNKHNVMTQERIDWKSISQKLDKPSTRCSDRWRNIEDSKNKLGPFTEEEDVLIECFVREWGNKGKGMWVRLQKDLGRPSSTIRKRWLLISQRTAEVVPDGCEK